ncbi:hypothetical protein D1007_55434 [Hordeum vulgare]|nr:hypothetical protein D1007_55434 [Hordeum vulgare]
MARSLPRRLALFCALASCVALAAGTTRSSRRGLAVDDSHDGAASVGVGGGRGYDDSLMPRPPPSSEPRACQFENERLYRAYLVIQKFRKTVICDPKGVTTTWSGTDLCGSYKGFFCGRPINVSDRTVASVDLNGYNLRSDSLQGFVDGLPDLALFHANSNNFGGAVPNLRGLQYFYELDLSNNKLAPAPFFGELPAGLFSSFPEVEAIFVNNNRFSGQLPDNLGDSPVNYLSLANNDFTGPIPSSIGRAADTLQEVLFLNNSLSGCLPYEIGLLARATVIDAGTNHLTGTIPLSYACLWSVEQLNLADNLLYGVVHDSLCRLAYDGRLANLTLSGNYFTWLGPCCWDLIREGKLNVDRNCILWAPNQRSFQECAEFFHENWARMTCPVSKYVPCHPKWYGVDAAKEEAVAAEENKYRTYSALHP